MPSKRAVVIDTNIWFKLSANPAYLPKILQLRQQCTEKGVHLAVPEVLVEEFRRHREEAKAAFMRQLRSAASLASRFGAQFDDVDHKTKLEQLDTQISEALKDLTARKEPKNIEEIERLLANPTCFKQSPEIFAAAGKRTFLRQPPSHNKPSVGDCILWECVLAHLKTYEVFFCSENTHEFAGSGGIALHPQLANEAGSCLNPLHYFVNVDDLMKALAPLEGLAGPPFVVGTDRFFEVGNPSLCPNCGARDAFGGGAFLRSRYGGLTWQHRCSQCGFLFDTGDSFDC